MLILDVNAGRCRPDIARFKLREKIARQDIFAVAVVVQEHGQIEVQIDHALAVQARDSLFGRFR
jgi:hypothetical protein